MTTSHPASAGPSPSPVARSTRYSGAWRLSGLTWFPRASSSAATRRPSVPVPPTMAIVMVSICPDDAASHHVTSRGRGLPSPAAAPGAGGWQAVAMRTVVVSGDGLTVEDVVDVARGEANAELAASVTATMERSREVIVHAVRGDAPVYGVNTGFGALADTRVAERDLAQLQSAIIVSHAAAAGDPLDDETVRALLLLRARTLAAGYSGVRPDLPTRMIEQLNLN